MMKMMMEIQKQSAANQAQMAQVMKTQAETYKLIREGMGADALMTPSMAEAAGMQAELLTETQEQVLGEEPDNLNITAGFTTP